MSGKFAKTWLLGVTLIGTLTVLPERVGAQDCSICITDYICEGATWNRHCWFDTEPPHLCLWAMGCEKVGGDPEEADPLDLRVLPTPDGPYVVTRISGDFFGRWMKCDGWVTELWKETEQGKLVPVDPEQQGLLYHPGVKNGDGST